MKKVTKKISAMALSMVFGMMQVSASTIVTGDTGLGVGNGGAVINNASGGYVNTTLGNDSATLNFNGNAHVNWDTLNVNKNETLNFNAMNPNGNMTVVNTVNSGMSNIYGAINSNEGISNLIISNPNGMLFDGATFTTAGNLLLTTQALSVNYANGNLDISGLQEEATNGIIIRDGADKKSNFNIGGEFNIVAPSIEIAGGYIGANKGLNLITKDGQNYLLAPSSSNNYLHKAVVLKAVNIDGDVYILSGEDVVTIAHGGKIVGDLKVDSKGNVGLNYENAGKVFEVTGNVDAKADGKANILRKGKVGGNLSMSNSGGYVEILSSDVNGNVDLKTTIDTNPDYKHFVHIVGENNIGGNLNIDSVHNIHVGGYEGDLQTHIPGDLNVAGDINAYAKDGSIAVTTDVKGNKVSLTSENLNIVSDGIATITAKEYEFQAKHYIGGVNDSNYLINTVMEKYTPIDKGIAGGISFLNIAGGEVKKLKQDNTSFAFLKSQGNMNVDNVDAGRVYITSNKDIVIKDNVKADTIKVGGETRNLTVKLPNRDYKLNYTNIKDTKVIEVNGDTEITYEMANGENGWNKGTQTDKNTYLVVPGAPVEPPVDPIVPPAKPTPEIPDNNDAEKILKNLTRDEVSTAIDAQQVMVPVAFAADLDDEIDTGVRKNVDGSVTVVRPFTPSK